MANFAKQGALALLLCFGAARAEATTVSVVYTFRSFGDAVQPSTLIYSEGTLYGTSSHGGTGNVGTVFGVSLAGTETLFHSANLETGYPLAGVIAFKGALYGLGTSGGRPAGCGIVFRINSRGLHHIYDFKGGTDGCYPSGSFVEVGGRFYGVTQSGGSGASGTVFVVTPKGVETVVHSFGPGDGQNPGTNLINFGRTLFGTTSSGIGAQGTGTVFQVTTSGAESVIANNVGHPVTGLVKIGGKLYGLSYASPYGAIYRVDADGTVSVIHNFRGHDGFFPASLINADGVLYGTTSFGGAYDNGTVFEIRQGGKFTTLYSFQGANDGRVPAALVNVNGTLYGVTQFKGTGGNGTIFKIVP